MWIKSQFKGVDLKDKRLNMRIEKIAINMMANPSASIPEQNKDWKDTKGAYRFFDSKRVKFNEVIKPHIELTKEEVRKRKIVLCIQDTCYITYSHHPSVKGLSRMGGGHNSKKAEGLILHNTLAVDPNKFHPEVIGILDQYIHNRNDAIDDEDWKETQLWIEASRRIHIADSKTQIVEVMDREGDVFDIMQNSLDLKHDFIIRAKNNRILKKSSEHNLFDFVKKLNPSGVIKLDVRKKKGQIRRKVSLNVSFSKVTLSGPKNRKNETINCNVVYVLEEKPPQDQEPLEWILLTSLEVNSFDDAYKIIKWYKYRWIIEEYHKCIKSGCAVEKIQLKEEFRIENFLGIANVVAVRLLQLRDHARLTPEISAKKVIDPLKLKILLTYSKIKKSEITIYEYYRLVAKIGGFLGRKADGEPGWQNLWKGESKLTLLVEGARMIIEGGISYG